MMSVKALVQKTKCLVRRSSLHSAVGGLVMISSFGYLGYMLVRNWGQLASYEWRIDYRQTAFAFVCYSLSLVLAVLGWGVIMSHFTQVRDLRRHLKYYVYTNLLRRLPAPLLYLFGRVYLYEREGVAKSLMVTISLVEWILIVLSGIIVYLLSLPFLPSSPVWHNPWFPAAILIAGVVLLHPRIIRVILRLLGQKELPVSLGYGSILACLIIYGLVWTGGGLMLYAAINSLYVLPFTLLPTVIGAWVLSGLITTLVFVTSAGLGLKELTLGLLLGYIMPSPLAIVVALLMRVCLIVFEIVWGIVALKL
jgi:uncharacterized membrane protein YbhN (UPF0104 family)